MIDLFKNRLAYLSISLVLLVIAFPLISIGTTRGPTVPWWAGSLALGCGGLIPPLQRLLLGTPPAVVASGSTQDDARSINPRWEGTVGHLRAIRTDHGTGFFEGGADPRGDGAAAGF